MIVIKLYFFHAYISYFQVISVEIFEVREARIGYQILPPCYGDPRVLLKYINFSSIKNKLTIEFKRMEMVSTKLYPRKLMV